jgi:hypothetical protein
VSHPRRSDRRERASERERARNALTAQEQMKVIAGRIAKPFRSKEWKRLEALDAEEILAKIEAKRSVSK